MLTDPDPAPAPVPAPPVPGRPHAVFRWGARPFAIDLGGVQEVVSELDLTPLPRTGPGWLGVGNLRGEILPAVSLEPWFPGGDAAAAAAATDAAAATAPTIFLILRTPLGKLALAASGFAQVTAMDPAAMAPAPWEDDAPEFASRQWRGGGTSHETVHCIDAARLAQNLQQQIQATFSAAPL